MYFSVDIFERDLNLWLGLKCFIEYIVEIQVD